MFFPLKNSLLQNKKAPRDNEGLATASFLAKNARLEGMGGWPGFRHFLPITVAGPRPSLTAFPAALAYKMKIESMLRCPRCQSTAKIVWPETHTPLRLSSDITRLATNALASGKMIYSCYRFFQFGFRFSTSARNPVHRVRFILSTPKHGY